MNRPTNEELLKKIEDAPLLMAKEAAQKKLRKARSIYGDQILFMLAITVIATCFSGWRVVAVCACSVLCCILTDMIGCFLSKKEYGVKDLSTIAYGMALALMLPASVEYYIVVIGAVLAITVKHIFGGKDLSRDFPFLGQSALFCVTEKTTCEQLQKLADALAAIVKEA